MFVDPTIGLDSNSGLTPDQPLATIQAAMDKLPFLHEKRIISKIDRMIEDRTGVITVFRGQPPKEKKKELEEWPPEPDNLNEEWWK